MSRIDELYCDPDSDEFDDEEEGFDPLLEEEPEPIFDHRADFIYDPIKDRSFGNECG